MVEFDRRKPFGITVAMVFLGLLASLGSVAGLANLLTSLFGEGPFLTNASSCQGTSFSVSLFHSFYSTSVCALWRGLPRGPSMLSIHVPGPCC